MFYFLRTTIASVLISLLTLGVFAYGASASTLDQKKAELAEIDRQIAMLNGDLATTKNQAFSLQQQIAQTDAEIAKTHAEIDRTQKLLEISQSETSNKSQQIAVADTDIASKEKQMKTLLWNLYMRNDDPVALILASEHFSDLLDAMERERQASDRILAAHETLQATRAQLADQHEELEARTGELAGLRSTLASQQHGLITLQNQKENLLSDKQKTIEKKEDLLDVTNATRAQILSQIFELTGAANGNITFGDALANAQFASAKTGVRPALILGVVQQESSLGKNVGQCSWRTDMHPDQRDAYQRVTRSIGIDPDSMRISCRPTTYSGWGGAMGPAQIMPTKWESIAASVSAIVGHPANPWNARDAFVANAIILQGLGAKAYDTPSERQAVGRYFAGNNWQRYPWYADNVLTKAAYFEEQIAKLT